MSSDLYAYDLDGTLCDPAPPRNKPYFKQSGSERREYEKIRRDHHRNAKLLMRPKEPFVIITGRSLKYRDHLDYWLDKNNLKPERVYMLTAPRTRKNMITHKIESFRKSGAVLYFEDDPKIARAMAKAGIPVVLINHTKGWRRYEDTNSEKEKDC